MDFVRTFVELVVQDNEEQFPWLRIAWESVRERVRISGLGTYGAAVWHECRLDNSIYQCEPTKVAFNPQFGIDEDGITHEFAHVYDFNTGLTPTRAWGAVQLYFNVTYEDCYPEIESIGSEFLADTMSHLIEPTAWLTYFESLIHPENGCYEYDREPSLLDEEVVLAGLAGNIPDWYTENITNGAELWAAFLSRPGDALLANIMHEFGGLCTTDWIRFPLDPDLFPAEGTNPFADGGC